MILFFEKNSGLSRTSCPAQLGTFIGQSGGVQCQRQAHLNDTHSFSTSKIVMIIYTIYSKSIHAVINKNLGKACSMPPLHAYQSRMSSSPLGHSIKIKKSRAPSPPNHRFGRINDGAPPMARDAKKSQSRGRKVPKTSNNTGHY